MRSSAGAVQGRVRLIVSGRHRVRSWRRTVALAFAVVALAFSILTVVIRALPVSNLATLVIAVGAPYTVLVAVAAMIVTVLARQVVLSVLAVVVVAVSFGIQLRWYSAGTAPRVGDGVEVRVLSSNLRYGRADPVQFVELARSGADVVTVTELTAEAVRDFHQAGIHETFPHSMLFPAGGAGGNGIWSRHPLTPISPTRFWNSSMVAAWVSVPELPVAPIVASVHVTSPMASLDSWRNGIAATKSRLTGLADAAAEGSVIAAGDFNSTPDMRQFRELLSDGYRDGVRQGGSGYAPTFPSFASLGWVPALITIDHVLMRRALVRQLRAVTVAGTDHRALLATVKIPIASTPS